MDFGFNDGAAGTATAGAQEEVTNLETGNKETVDINGEVIPPIDDDTANGGEQKPAKEDSEKGKAKDGKSNSYGLEFGSVVTIGESKYTVDRDGNLVDDKNNIFKEAKDVDAYLKEFEVEDADSKTFDIKNIIEEIGIDITDENDNVIEFENSPKGIASYIDSVIELRQAEIAQAGVQKLIETYPIVSDFLNYYIANGNSYEGFGQTRDRSTITIDENNTAQQEAIIREAFKESGRSGSIDSYIKYLKDTNNLLDAAKQELAALQESDKAYKKQQAEAARQKLEEDRNNEITYWNGVKAAIDKKEIAGYKIPDTIIINKDGKQIAATPNDFFNYLYQVDKNGYSRYEKELAAIAPEEQLQDELLRAYLKFTGGSYSNLVDLAMASKETKNLRFRAAENKRKTTVSISKPEKKESILDNIDKALGIV